MADDIPERRRPHRERALAASALFAYEDEAATRRGPIVGDAADDFADRMRQHRDRAWASNSFFDLDFDELPDEMPDPTPVPPWRAAAESPTATPRPAQAASAPALYRPPHLRGRARTASPAPRTEGEAPREAEAGPARARSGEPRLIPRVALGARGETAPFQLMTASAYMAGLASAKRDSMALLAADPSDVEAARKLVDAHEMLQKFKEHTKEAGRIGDPRARRDLAAGHTYRMVKRKLESRKRAEAHRAETMKARSKKRIELEKACYAKHRSGDRKGAPANSSYELAEPLSSDPGRQRKKLTRAEKNDFREEEDEHMPPVRARDWSKPVSMKRHGRWVGVPRTDKKPTPPGYPPPPRRYREQAAEAAASRPVPILKARAEVAAGKLVPTLRARTGGAFRAKTGARPPFKGSVGRKRAADGPQRVAEGSLSGPADTRPPEAAAEKLADGSASSPARTAAAPETRNPAASSGVKAETPPPLPPDDGWPPPDDLMVDDDDDGENEAGKGDPMERGDPELDKGDPMETGDPDGDEELKEEPPDYGEPPPSPMVEDDDDATPAKEEAPREASRPVPTQAPELANPWRLMTSPEARAASLTAFFAAEAAAQSIAAAEWHPAWTTAPRLPLPVSPYGYRWQLIPLHPRAGHERGPRDDEDLARLAAGADGEPLPQPRKRVRLQADDPPPDPPRVAKARPRQAPWLATAANLGQEAAPVEPARLELTAPPEQSFPPWPDWSEVEAAAKASYWQDTWTDPRRPGTPLRPPAEVEEEADGDEAEAVDGPEENIVTGPVAGEVADSAAPEAIALPPTAAQAEIAPPSN